MSFTTSSVTSMLEYSWRAEGAGGRPSRDADRAPPWTLTPASSSAFCTATTPDAAPAQCIGMGVKVGMGMSSPRLMLRLPLYSVRPTMSTTTTTAAAAFCNRHITRRRVQVV